MRIPKQCPVKAVIAHLGLTMTALTAPEGFAARSTRYTTGGQAVVQIATRSGGRYLLVSGFTSSRQEWWFIHWVVKMRRVVRQFGHPPIP